MENTIKNAIETYSTLTGQNSNDILKKCLNGDEIILENIKKIMFSISLK